MDNAKTRSTKPIRLSTAIGRHVDTAFYLLGAEIRFKSYCAWLYCHKRPRLIRNYEWSAVCAATIFALAGVMQYFM